VGESKNVLSHLGKVGWIAVEVLSTEEVLLRADLSVI
jgi:hypothetical protein